MNHKQKNSKSFENRQGQGQQNQQSHTPGQKVQQEIPSYGSQTSPRKPKPCKHKPLQPSHGEL